MQAIPVRPLRILVAEDTPFNRKFILNLVERWGHRATVAESSSQLLELLEKDSFDLILMDVHMLEVVYLEASRSSRKSEQRASAPPPIVAMTTHTLKSERAHWLGSGMVKYVSKPISPEILYKTIREILPDEINNALGDAIKADIPPSLDKETLLNTFDRDRDFLAEIVNLFLSEAPPMVKTINKALQEKDADTLRRTAHSLKGMLLNFLAESAARTAFKLEERGREKAFDGSDTEYKKLVVQLNEIYKILSDILKEVT